LWPAGCWGGEHLKAARRRAALGLALHFLIAFGVVTIFYASARNLAFVRARPIASGLAYGLIVFAVMNLVVLPLSAATTRHALVPDLVQVAIHMFVIGVPTSLLIRRFSGASAR